MEFLTREIKVDMIRTKNQSDGVSAGIRGGKRAGAGRPKMIHQTLDEEYKDDQTLLTLYKKKLLHRGWAGTKTKNEQDYVRSRAK